MSKVGYSSEAFWILFSGVFFIFWLTKLKRRHGIVSLKDDKKQTEKSHWLLRILALVNNLEILRDQRSGISDRFVILEIPSDNLKTAYYARSQRLKKGTTLTCLAQWNPHKNVAKEFEFWMRTTDIPTWWIFLFCISGFRNFSTYFSKSTNKCKRSKIEKKGLSITAQSDFILRLSSDLRK